MTRELNSLDLEVKRMMLEYPSLYPTRIHCLETLFCTNGTGYDWNDKGRLSNVLDDPNRPMPEHIKEAEPYDFGKCQDQMSDSESVRLEYEGVVRGFREKHIDYLCSTPHSSIAGNELSYTSVYPMSWNYCNMGKAADMPNEIADEWRAGIHEFIHWFLPKVNGAYGCWNEDGATEPDVDRIKDPRAKENYIICQKVMKMLKTEADIKRDAEVMALHEELLAEVLQEMNDDKA